MNRNSDKEQPLGYLSAAELTRLYRSGEVSPIDVVESLIERSTRVVDQVNPFSEVLDDLARESAAESDRRFRESPGTVRPLEGIPVALKEEHRIRGYSQRNGSLLTDHTPSTVDHPVVERTISAGGIVHARTTTPENSGALHCHTKLWGVTRNPWDLSRTSGGSSGGAAAALAAGATTLASGSDYAGSIRLPAGFCGVVGLKPTYGRVPMLAPDYLLTATHDGPMARTVADVSRYFDVLVGPDPQDPVSLPLELDGGPALLNEDLRIAFTTEVSDYLISDDVLQVLTTIREALAGVGPVHDVKVAAPERTMIRTALFAATGRFPELDASAEELIETYSRALHREIRVATERMSPLEAFGVASEVYQSIADAMRGADILVMPVAGVTAFSAIHNVEDSPVVINGVAMESDMDAAFTPIFNVASRHPVVSIPAGLTSSGLPVGIQVIARPYQDRLALLAAERIEGSLRFLEKAGGWPKF